MIKAITDATIRTPEDTVVVVALQSEVEKPMSV
jgi:hypothetical protein